MRDVSGTTMTETLKRLVRKFIAFVGHANLVNEGDLLKASYLYFYS